MPAMIYSSIGHINCPSWKPASGTGETSTYIAMRRQQQQQDSSVWALLSVKGSSANALHNWTVNHWCIQRLYGWVFWQLLTALCDA